MRVLVIEDDASVRRALIGALRRVFPGVDTIAAESADEAIMLLRESACEGPAFDLITSDYNLLGARTGGDVLDWIQAHLSHLESRFVFVSGNDAIRLRGVPFLEKPFVFADLREVLHGVVTNR